MPKYLRNEADIVEALAEAGFGEPYLSARGFDAKALDRMIRRYKLFVLDVMKALVKAGFNGPYLDTFAFGAEVLSLYRTLRRERRTRTSWLPAFIEGVDEGLEFPPEFEPREGKPPEYLAGFSIGRLAKPTTRTL